MNQHEPLTQEQIAFARHQVARWLQVKFAHEDRGAMVRILRMLIGETCDRAGTDTIPWRELHHVNSLIPDADHSALLWRLLEGKEPLDEPPPTQHAYPVYPD